MRLFSSAIIVATDKQETASLRARLLAVRAERPRARGRHLPNARIGAGFEQHRALTALGSSWFASGSVLLPPCCLPWPASLGQRRRQRAKPCPNRSYTRQGTFAIPFRVETPPADVSPPTKVRLFVSENEGHNWHLDGEVAPTKQAFDFRSSHDGEYWFTIRSIDGQGRSYPDGAYDPQLRVIVDTLAPRLDLRAERGANGEITAHWDVVDTAIDPASFKLEYQFAGGGWQTLAIESGVATRREANACRRNVLVAAGRKWPDRTAGERHRPGR